VTAGHRGCSTDELLDKLFLGPTSLAKVHRGPRLQETTIGTQKSEGFIRDTNYFGVQWGISDRVRPTL